MKKQQIKGVKIIWINERGDKLGIQVIYKSKFYQGYLMRDESKTVL